MKKFLLALIAAIGLMAPLHAGDITGTGINQGDLAKLLANIVRNQQFALVSTANLGISLFVTSDVTLGVTADEWQYISGGQFYRGTATNNIHVVSSESQATGTIADYLLTYNQSTAVFTITKGPSDTITANVVLPAVPASGVPIGVIRVSTGTAGTFTFGVEGLDTAAYTVSYRDIRTPITGPSKVSTTGL